MKATNYARATYQEVYDIMTRDGKVSIFGFHTPTGEAPYSMLHGFFSQFRKYKYSGMKVNIIPAAQLPADPLQISYEAGTESYIDPRDLQNPVLFHGAHGNNLGDVLNMIYSTSFGESVTDGSIERHEMDNDVTFRSGSWSIEDWYYSSMLDPSFRKFNVMNNMSLPFMSPRVHPVTTNMVLQPNFKPNGDFNIETPNIDRDNANLPTYTGGIEYAFPRVPSITSDGILSSGVGPLLMSNKLTKLGWMDTFTFTKAPNTEHDGTTLDQSFPVVSPLPKIMMGALIMPPSYRTKLAFRVVISHYFEFARFNTSITPTAVGRTVGTLSQAIWNYHDWLPAELTESTSYAESNSIDSLDGDVHQNVSGVM